MDYLAFRIVNTWAGQDVRLDAAMRGIAQYGSLVFVVALIWLWGLRQHPPSARDRLAVGRALAAAGVALAVGQILAWALSRPRPFRRHQVHLLIAPSGDPSFPSDHALAAFAIAAAVVSTRRRLGLTLFGFGALLGLARVFVGTHYPSDILGGAVLGGAIGALAQRGDPWLRPMVNLLARRLTLPSGSGGDELVRRSWIRRPIRRALGAGRRWWIVLVEHLRFTEARRYVRPILRVPDDWRSPYARFWLELVGGAVALVAAASLFGLVAEDVVTGDPLTIVDEILAQWLYAHATPGVTRAMFVATELGGPAVVTGVTLATAFLLVWRRRWPWLLTLILVVPGGALLNELLKIAFRRARPTFAMPILALKGYGFPSGHTMIATLLYGLLAVLLMRTLGGLRSRMLVAGVGAALVMLVGLSRMYLGAHYLSDILAAVAAGLAWLVLCLTAVATLRYRRRRRR